MRLSQKRTTALYGAISGPVMDLRVKYASAWRCGDELNSKVVDEDLYQLEQRIWARVEAALNLEAET